MATDGDIDIAAKSRQQPQQAFDGHIPKLPIEQTRHVWLTKTHAFGRFGLGEVLLGDYPLNSGHQFSFEQMGFSIGKAEISKNILRAAPDAGVSGSFFMIIFLFQARFIFLRLFRQPF